MKFQVVQGNVFDMLPAIERGSIDAVVTSPPYWKLRSYLKPNHPLKKYELGSEPTPQKFVENMVRVFGLVRECMADHATCWVNIGETYSESGRCLIPERLTIALQADGWIVRSVIVWRKPSPMPCSVSGWRWVRCRVKVKAQKQATEAGMYASGSGNRTARPGSGGVTGVMPPEYQTQWSDCPGCKKCKPHDGYVLRRGSWRPTSSWEPVLMLAKSAKYFCDGDAVKTPAKTATLERNQYSRIIDDPDEQYSVSHDHETNLATANLRDVWTIAAEPLKAAHYAAFPTELVTTCLSAAVSERGYCSTCGAPWVRKVETTPIGSYHDHSADGVEFGLAQRSGRPRALDGRKSEKNAPEYKPAQTIGWLPSCDCPDSTPRPGRVLDPFAGSGRTLIAARRLGFDAVGVELHPEYAAMCERLVRDDMPLFSA